MRRATRQWITWSSILVGVALLVWAAVSAARPNPAGAVPAPDAAVDHVHGSLTSKAILIEYGDFQCPACGAYEPIVEQVTQHFGDKMALVFREYPLTQVHEHAQIAAQAAEAANLQGKFWEYHDLLYQRQSSWPAALDVEQTLTDYATELKLDATKFRSDMNSQAVKDRVQRDLTTGTAANIPGTPTFFLNGKEISNPSSADSFITIINNALGTNNS